MPSKTKKDRTYSASTTSPVIKEMQELVNRECEGFPWAKMLEEKEVRFVYDMVAWAEARAGFVPSAAQGRWGVQILWKLKASTSQWQATQRKTSKVSGRADCVARRLAKEYLKRRNVPFNKTTPSDLELAKLLHAMGAMDTQPTRASAKELLISWSKALEASTTTARSGRRIPRAPSQTTLATTPSSADLPW